MLKFFDRIKEFITFIIIILSLVVISGLYNATFATVVQGFDTYDFKMDRYWQGLSNSQWRNWFVNYSRLLLERHDALYRSTQRSGHGRYFKSGEIKYRPLIIWFATKNGSVTEPRVIISSGSKRYDTFNCQVIKTTKVPAFPHDKNRIFMWDGEINEVVKYLKYKGVMPVNYSLKNNVSPFDIRWEKI